MNPTTPLTPHANNHTESELKRMKEYLRRTPYISMSKLYSKLKVDKEKAR